VLRLSRARVVTANYAVIQHDFPELRDDSLLGLRPGLTRLHGPDRAAAIHQLIDTWLLANAGIISERQAAQTQVNTPIEHTGETVTAYRPPLYGRALVVPTAAPIAGTQVKVRGLLDLKGTGVAPDQSPAQRHHSNGLMTLGDALKDLVFQWLIDEIFQHAAPHFWTVPVYAVLDLGFDAIFRNGEHRPAGMQIRRAHARPPHGDLPMPGSPEEQVRLEIEMLLRSYGISSCGASTAIRVEGREGHLEVFQGPDRLSGLTDEQRSRLRKLTRFKSKPLYFEGINIQLARGVRLNPSRAQVVDFGHYAARADFRHPVVNLVRGRLLNWGGALWPNDPLFIQPDPRLVLPDSMHAYGPDGPSIRRPMSEEMLFARPHALARQFRENLIPREALESQLAELITLATRGWNPQHTCPPAPP